MDNTEINLGTDICNFLVQYSNKIQTKQNKCIFSYLCSSLLICVIIITLHNYTYNYKVTFIII